LGQQRLATRGRLHAIGFLSESEALKQSPICSGLPSLTARRTCGPKQCARWPIWLIPRLPKHQLDAGPDDAELAARLATLGRGQLRRVLLEIIFALGRLQWLRTADWLKENLDQPYAALARGNAGAPAIEKLA
jgi:hypothetical protein